MPRLFISALAVVTLLLFGISPSVAQDKGKNKKDKGDVAQSAEINALMAAVDALMGGNAGDNTLPLKWEQHHFIKALGSKTALLQKPFDLKALESAVSKLLPQRSEAVSRTPDE